MEEVVVRRLFRIQKNHLDKHYRNPSSGGFTKKQKNIAQK